MGKKYQVIIFKLNKYKSLEYFANIWFAGGWQKVDADKPENMLSRSGCVISYADYHIVYMSKLQTKIALSMAETKYTALSQSIREVISLI